MRRAWIFAKKKTAKKILRIPVWQNAEVSYVEPNITQVTGSKAASLMRLEWEDSK